MKLLFNSVIDEVFGERDKLRARKKMFVLVAIENVVTCFKREEFRD